MWGRAWTVPKGEWSQRITFGRWISPSSPCSGNWTQVARFVKASFLLSHLNDPCLYLVANSKLKLFLTRNSLTNRVSDSGKKRSMFHKEQSRQVAHCLPPQLWDENGEPQLCCQPGLRSYLKVSKAKRINYRRHLWSLTKQSAGELLHFVFVLTLSGCLIKIFMKIPSLTLNFTQKSLAEKICSDFSDLFMRSCFFRKDFLSNKTLSPSNVELCTIPIFISNNYHTVCNYKIFELILVQWIND